METLPDILRVNEVIVYFAYGLVFFTMGVVIALQSRKHSRLALARHLRWLAAFGIVHGVYEWGHAFIPIQAMYLPVDAVTTLEAIRTVTLLLSYYLLLQFGVLITFPAPRHAFALRFFPNAVLLIWLALAIGTEAIVFAGPAVAMRLPQTTDLVRVSVGFTGAVVASWGMIRQSQIVSKVGPQRITWYFRWTALCFGLYAIVAGLIASRGEWAFSTLPTGEWPFSTLSELPFLVGAGTIPAPVWRSITALGIAVGVVRGLEVFQIETDRFIGEKDELARKEEVRAHFLARVIAAQEEERKRGGS